MIVIFGTHILPNNGCGQQTVMVKLPDNTEVPATPHPARKCQNLNFFFHKQNQHMIHKSLLYHHKYAPDKVCFKRYFRDTFVPCDLRGRPGRVAQAVGHLTRKSGVLGSIPALATYFRFSFRFFKKGSCQLLAKVCARSTG